MNVDLPINSLLAKTTSGEWGVRGWDQGFGNLNPFAGEWWANGENTY